MSVTALPEYRTEVPASLADQAYQQLRDRLTVLEIRPGAMIHDAHLATELGIGRTPVREALKRLETDHLVVSYPRRGTFATQVDITALSDVSELRRNLEPLAAHKAALAAPPAVRQQMHALVHTLGDLSGGEPTNRAFMRADLTVHRLIYRAAGNAHLEETLVRLDNLATRIWCLVLDRVPTVSAHVHEHVGLLEAIAAGRADEAADLALEHVTSFERTMRTVL
ncbi:GntR family transcriptional regulator [Kocuria sp. M1R5S2]|uniref:GntR family transcriptional regulator n=1 Tax=Kocuria rhizosphaerae TaxID=3376285 RepID=UPI0037BCAC2E